MPGSIIKDQALTKIFGAVGGAASVPMASFALFTVRDLATMAAAFTLPTPMSAKVINGCRNIYSGEEAGWRRTGGEGYDRGVGFSLCFSFELYCEEVISTAYLFLGLQPRSLFIASSIEMFQGSRYTACVKRIFHVSPSLVVGVFARKVYHWLFFQLDRCSRSSHDVRYLLVCAISNCELYCVSSLSNIT